MTEESSDEQGAAMIESSDRDLARAVEAVVRDVEGVTGVFRSGGFAAKAVDAGARLIGIRAGDEALVAVDREAAGIRVDVAVGIDGAAGAVATTRRVHEAIGRLGTALGSPFVEIRVTVAHIEEPAPGAALT